MNKAIENYIITYNKKAKKYDRTIEGKFTKSFRELVNEELDGQVGESILDLGCANGTLLNMLNEKYKIVGIGIDSSKEMIKAAKMKFPKVNFFRAYCEDLPFKDKYFHKLTICSTFHHFLKPRIVLRECHRVLREDGLLYICELRLPQFIRKLFNPFLWLSESGNFKLYGPEEIEKMAQIENFTLIKEYKKGIKILQVFKKI